MLAWGISKLIHSALAIGTLCPWIVDLIEMAMFLYVTYLTKNLMQVTGPMHVLNFLCISISSHVIASYTVLMVKLIG